MLSYIPKKLTEGRLCSANNLQSAKIYVQLIGHGKIKRADIIVLTKTHCHFALHLNRHQLVKIYDQVYPSSFVWSLGLVIPFPMENWAMQHYSHGSEKKPLKSPTYTNMKNNKKLNYEFIKGSIPANEEKRTTLNPLLPCSPNRHLATLLMKNSLD